MFPEQGCSHAEEVKWIVGVTKKSRERGTRQGVGSRGWRQSHARGERAVGQMVVEIDADAMSVLGMLKQEPSAGEGLLAGRTDVAGRFVFISFLLLGADSLGRRQPPLLVLLSPGEIGRAHV